MNLKRKRITSALRTLYINNNPVSPHTTKDNIKARWSQPNGLTPNSATLVIVNDQPLYDKLISQRIIKTKKPKRKHKCQCGVCRSASRPLRVKPIKYISEYNYK